MTNWRSSSSNVVSQGRCVHNGCKSSDAYTTYKDGSTYCFSCTNFTKATQGEYKGSIYVKPEESVNKPNALKPYASRQDIDLFNCKELYLHLRQYLEDEEIDKHFFYAPLFARYVFAHKEGTEEAFYEARGTPNRIPKSLQEGTKPTYIFGKVKESGIVVVVEDMISAIKVSRHFGVLPLFGSYMSPRMMAEISKIPNLKMVVMWLDNDKYGTGMKYAKDMGMLIHSAAVHTEKDPKAYGSPAIQHIVNKALDEKEALDEQNTNAIN